MIEQIVVCLVSIAAAQSDAAEVEALKPALFRDLACYNAVLAWNFFWLWRNNPISSAVAIMAQVQQIRAVSARQEGGAAASPSPATAARPPPTGPGQE
jgi:hypothetical protein